MKKSVFIFLPFLILNCTTLKNENYITKKEVSTNIEIEKINNLIKIPNKLLFDKEIRVYKKNSISNLTELFRMYKENNKWNVELYKYYDKINNSADNSKIEKINPKSISDLNLIWLYILETNVEFLPSIDKIEYKLKGAPRYELNRDGYEVYHSKIKSLDGFVFTVFVKNVDNYNTFCFFNPDLYFKNYPEIDEVKSYAELVNIINKEFNIWEKEK